MKIDVSKIVFDFIGTIRGERWSITSIFDMVVLFGVPSIASASSIWFKESIKSEFYLSLFTLFGVFVAVFIAVQGVLVSLHGAPPPSTNNSSSISGKQRLRDRNQLVKEVSFALSYLKLIMIIGMAIFVIPIATGSDLFLFKWMAVGMAVHLFINLLIISKRLHALFHFQFSDE
ncbi:hypothetical protein [Erythrobacter rubeus]|uniref:Uncharacterized protein n=1 Tax=Erythrobacter rubeus TaxID=2760803 RepID=A0ABR8KLU3_9SPHN|nr:hypothetical protein [Erythrobacter rubeus]MBD2841412.1 hypothetical protein [Erythrobacter rubeus]